MLAHVAHNSRRSEPRRYVVAARTGEGGLLASAALGDGECYWGWAGGRSLGANVCPYGGPCGYVDGVAANIRGRGMLAEVTVR